MFQRGAALLYTIDEVTENIICQVLAHKQWPDADRVLPCSFLNQKQILVSQRGNTKLTNVKCWIYCHNTRYILRGAIRLQVLELGCCRQHQKEWVGMGLDASNEHIIWIPLLLIICH